MSLRWSSFLITIGLLGAVTGNLLAQSDVIDLLKPKKKSAGAPPPAKVNVTAEPTGRGTVTLSVKVELPAGFYTYSTEGDFGARTRIQIESSGLKPLGDGFVPDKPGKTEFDPILKENLTKHHGTVTWTREFQLPTDVSGDGSLDVKGTVEGQYCSDPQAGGVCVPLKHPFWLTVLARSAPEKTSPRYDAVIKPERKGATNPDPVEYTVQLTPKDAAKGDTVTLSITAKLQSGWHTYSLTQKDIGGEPTEIDASSLRNLEAIDAEFTPSKPPTKEDGANNNVLATYHDDVTWTRKYRATGDTPGDYGISGEISYQLCDAVRCLPVNVVPFVLGQVTDETPSPFSQVASDEAPSPFSQVTRDADPPKAENPPVAEPAQEPFAEPAHEPVVAKAVGVAPKPQDRTLFVFLVVCILGGFGAVLTPCSYPMVPITVSFFLKQAEKEHKSLLLLATVYSGTIVLAFTFFGVVVSYLMGDTGANRLATNSILNWIIGTIFVVFALNMLGAYEIRVPSGLLNWAAARGGSGGYLGAIFMAITFTLTSFTCTFAIAGALVAQAAQGDFFRPTLGMLAFGTAFASPFFVLALTPTLLKKMPKSGGWMNAVKVVLGLVELGAAIKFFSIADNPNPVLFDYVTVMIIWGVLSLVTGLYLLGVYRFEHDTPAGPIPLESALLGTAFLALAGLLGFLTVYPERSTGWVMENIVAFAPPRFEGPSSMTVARAPVGNVNTTSNDPVVTHHGLTFLMDYRRALEIAQTERRPVLYDFTGVVCNNCRLMEGVMGRPENHERIQKFVAAALYVDRIPKIQDPSVAEKMLADNQELQAALVGDRSMPVYAIVTPDGKDVLATHIGYDPGSAFTEFLDEGWRNWQARSQTASR